MRQERIPIASHLPLATFCMLFHGRIRVEQTHQTLPESSLRIIEGCFSYVS